MRLPSRFPFSAPVFPSLKLSSNARFTIPKAHKHYKCLPSHQYHKTTGIDFTGIDFWNLETDIFPCTIRWRIRELASNRSHCCHKCTHGSGIHVNIVKICKTSARSRNRFSMVKKAYVTQGTTTYMNKITTETRLIDETKSSLVTKIVKLKMKTEQNDRGNNWKALQQIKTTYQIQTNQNWRTSRIWELRVYTSTRPECQQTTNVTKECCKVDKLQISTSSIARIM